MTGAMPCDEIDHIDHDRCNNRWENLREVTHRENSMNTSMRSDNTSGAMGVSFAKREQKYNAYIHVDGKRKSLGYFEDINDAIAARVAAEVEFGYHVNHGITGIGD